MEASHYISDLMIWFYFIYFKLTITLVECRHFVGRMHCIFRSDEQP